MKYLLERHAYAPELNKVYRVIGERLVLVAKASSAIGQRAFSSLKEYRAHNRPPQAFIHARVTTHYTDPAHKSLERTYAGRVPDRQAALAFARKIKAGLLPQGTLRIQTQVVFG